MRPLWPIGIALSALALLALVPTAAGRGAAERTWSGTWASEWGEMKLTQSGASVSGNYTHDAGHIAGTVSGNVFTGRWDEAPSRKGPSDAGAVVLTLAADGKSFTGKWNYDANPNGWATNWSGRCTAGACLQNATQRRTCTKVYAIVPSGEQITANVRLVDFTRAQKEAAIKAERTRYEGFPYTPIRTATRKQNCAGFVMARLFGSKMVEAQAEPDEFFRKIVQRYGTERLGRLTARAGDVVVYRTPDGMVKHVAVVDSNVVRLKILTKDGDESTFRATVPLPPLRLSNDPLVVAHTARGEGTIEFWKVDTSKVTIRALRTGQCDD